ncbi:MAG: InlB B-repeat-containing protein, partial [Bacilli bacterium]|nr:InlB B-repeat-containing protein [Bacilli bacterium]
LHGNDSTTEGAIRVQDKFVSFTLMKEVGNNNWETIIDSESYDNFEEPLRIYVDKIDANTTSTVTHKYRLYVWLNRDMTIYGGDLTSESGDYSIAEYKKLYTSVKIQVTGDYKEKNYEIPVHTVTFDYNDGVTESTTKRVVYHGHYGNLPTPPEREGYTFMGWNGKNMFNKEKAILDGIRNETPIQSWGKDGINNNWIVSNLFPDVLYTISFDVECTQVPIYDKKYSPGYGYLLLWKDSNNNLWIGNAEYLQVGDRRHIIQQLIIPNSLEGYVIAFYTNRYLYNGSAVLGTMIFSNIQIAEGDTATEYEPYYITSDTKVVQDHDHTLKAIWKENE